MKIEIPHVVADTDRHGNVRVYYRRKGHRKIRLFETPGSQEFNAELDAAKKCADDDAAANASAPADDTIDDATIVPGSLRALCVEYFGSTPFKQLDDITRRRRRATLERICQSKTSGGLVRGKLPFVRMEESHVEEIRDIDIEKPDAANSRVKAMRGLFKWAKKPKKLKANPAAGVAYIETDSDGHHTWTIEEVEQYWEAHRLGTMARLAMDLLLFTGTRRSDAVRLGPPMERAGALHFTEWKNSRKKVGRRKEGPKQQDIPILEVLRVTIDATTTGIRTYLVTAFGKPFTSNGFGNYFKKRCRDAGLPDRCTAHGLRKAGATFAADNGATEHQLMAIYGWDDPKQAALYTRKANRRRLAAGAMHLLIPTPENETGPGVSHRKSAGGVPPRKVH